MATNELAVLDAHSAVESVKVLANIVHALYDDVFKEGLDYGKIPGTNDKPVLLLPGMEKLLRALHLRAEYVLLTSEQDFEKLRFYFRYECRLVDIDSGVCVSTAIGSANSYESKWRWREQKRACPHCGKETINRSKYPPRGAPEGTDPGWYCYAKIGGCGAEFAYGDERITSQSVGRMENPDIADQVNTIDKIAQKRSLSSSVKGAANVSELFTVDLEDLVEYVTGAAPAVKPAESSVVEGSFTELTEGAQGEAVVAVWTEADMKRFVKEYRQAAISDKEALAALGVSGLRAFKGTLADAQYRLDAYVAAQLGVLAEAHTEADPLDWTARTARTVEA